jgi:ABC-type phosphate/phosphonate transport system substrate-binding protein
MTTPTPRRSVSAAGRTGTSFRFIVAAEDGVALGDLKPLARRLMEQMGKDVVASAAARSPGIVRGMGVPIAARSRITAHARLCR